MSGHQGLKSSVFFAALALMIRECRRFSHTQRTHPTPVRTVSTHFIIIRSVFGKNSLKVLGVENDQMISALAPDRPDQAIHISVLPGRAERDGPVPDAHCSHASLECDAECSVIVADEKFRCPLPRKRFGDLACQPLGRRISGHRNPQQQPPAVAENKKCE
jgi:hypothetical protein